MRIVLGLLGGIGSGKSFVARRLVELAGGEVLDADVLAREALEQAASDGRLAQALGAGLVTEAGAPDRAAIARRAFSDPEALRALERLTHPAVHARIRARLAAHRAGEGPDLLVLDVPLLLEVGLDRACDALWFVETSEATRRARTRRRGLEDAQAAAREAQQSPLARKRGRADFVLHNDGDGSDLDRQLLAGLRALGMRPADEA
jgi:dephospho-CoA kinase